MFTILIIIHVVVCVLLVCTVLLQQGKGAEIGAVFGGSEAIFGSAGPTTFLNKLTSALAIIFMLTSLGLTYLASHRGSVSVMENVGTVAPVKVPKVPPVSTVAPKEIPKGHLAVPAGQEKEKGHEQPSGNKAGASDANASN